jgi:hypothetical protein
MSLSIALVLAAILGQEAPASVLMLHLRDGRVAWGTIQSHEPDGFVFARLDNGGVARLPWGMLDPAQEKELRLQFGYVDLSRDEVMVTADRIQTTDGTEFVGIILDRTPDAILLKTLGSTLAIRKDRIGAGSVSVRVPAREIYTKQELYDQYVSSTPPADAAGHFAAGELCERIFDFGRAVEHYRRAAELDPKFRPSDVQIGIARATEKGKNQDQLDYLSDVDSDLRQRRYDKAYAKADAFAAKFPGSPLGADAKKAKDQILKARDAYLASEVRRLWVVKAEKLAHKAALEMNLQQALAYVTEALPQDLVEGIVKDLKKVSKDLSPDTVKQMWASRKKIRYQRASYGLGTWLLGKDEALKGEDGGKDANAKDKPPDTELGKERAEFEKKLKLFLKNQEMARKSQSTEEKQEDRDAFWRDYGALSKEQWLLAYFAENSGLFELSKHPTLDNCPDCGGRGVREIDVVGANVSKGMTGKGQNTTNAECPICHGIGRIRRISFR